MLNLEHKIVQQILLGKLAKNHVFRWLWNEEAKAFRLRKLPKIFCQHMTSSDRTVGRGKCTDKKENKIFLIYKENKKERLQSHI